MDVEKYLIILLIAHILGDFYFQTEKLAKLKEERYTGVLIHSFEYWSVSVCVMIPMINLDMLLASTCLSLFHLLIDSVKYILVNEKKVINSEKVFIWDQSFHMLSIFILSYIMLCWNFNISSYKIINDIFAAYKVEKMMLLRWILVFLCLCKPSNILIQNLLSGYKPKEKSESQIIIVDNRAGRRIGVLERLIMFMFIAMNQYAALGLVLTAKSIARYDKIAKDEKFAEYYLLGTLLSTACVVICKLLIM